MEEIKVLEEFNNGIEDCQKLYNEKFKILEKTNNHLWNTDENHPICIVKRRAADYELSNELAEKIEEEKIEEDELKIVKPKKK